jgi:hypothetical protein
MSFLFLFLGSLFLLTGVAYLAYLMSVPEAYAVGSALLLLCLAGITSLQTSRRSRI